VGEYAEGSKELATKRISRRTFLMGVAGAAGLGVFGGSLAGCAAGTGSGGTTSTPGTAATGAPAANPAVDTVAAKVKGEGRTLRVLMNGGKLSDVIHASVIEPFEKKYGANVEVIPSTSAEMMTRVRSEKANPTIDLVYIDDIVAPLGISEGLFEKIDPSNIPNLKDVDERFVNKDGYGPGGHGVAITFAYNKELVKVDPPTSWADLWKPDYKDMLAMSSINLSPAILFLVQAAQLNGGSYDNIDPGFEAIKRLIPNVRIWWRDTGIIRSNVDKDGVVGIFGQSYWLDEIGKGIPLVPIVPKEGAHFSAVTLQLVKGSKNKDLAELLINEHLSESGQLGIARGNYNSIVNKKVVLPDDLKGKVVSNLNLQYFDPVKIAANRDAWMERWMKDLKV